MKIFISPKFLGSEWRGRRRMMMGREGRGGREGREGRGGRRKRIEEEEGMRKEGYSEKSRGGPDTP